MSARHHARKRSVHHKPAPRKKARKASKTAHHSAKTHKQKKLTVRARKVHLMKAKKLRPPKRHGEVTH